MIGAMLDARTIAREIQELIASDERDETKLARIRELTGVSEQDARLMLARSRGDLEEIERDSEVV
jgi:hypothetical protein